MDESVSFRLPRYSGGVGGGISKKREVVTCDRRDRRKGSDDIKGVREQRGKCAGKKGNEEYENLEIEEIYMENESK